MKHAVFLDRKHIDETCVFLDGKPVETSVFPTWKQTNLALKPVTSISVFYDANI